MAHYTCTLCEFKWSSCPHTCMNCKKAKPSEVKEEAETESRELRYLQEALDDVKQDLLATIDLAGTIIAIKDREILLLKAELEKLKNDQEPDPNPLPSL